MWGHGIARHKSVSNLARGALKQESSSLWNDDFCWQISSLLEIFDSLALDACSHKIFVVLASGSGLKELAEEGRVYLAIYNLYNLNLRRTLLIWNTDCTAKSDKLSRWRKGPCPLFSSAKKIQQHLGGMVINTRCVRPQAEGETEHFKDVPKGIPVELKSFCLHN